MATAPITTSNAVPRLLYTVTSFVVSEQNRMGKQLTDKAIQQFHERGYYLPLDVASVEEIQEMRRQLEVFEAKTGGALRGTNRFKNHLLFKWLSDLIRSPKILDAVEDLIGPNLLVWSTDWWRNQQSSCPGTRIVNTGDSTPANLSRSGWHCRRPRWRVDVCAFYRAVIWGLIFLTKRLFTMTTC